MQPAPRVLLQLTRIRIDNLASLEASDAAAGRPPAALLIIDPPWENRSARRARVYYCMTQQLISEIEIGDW
jgi:hypothetical protein